jgi:hypothetical protein
MSGAPESIYFLTAGNGSEVIRERKTESTEKLMEWILRYKTRAGITNMVIARRDVAQEHASPDPRITILAMGDAVPMLALTRENEESPWTEIPIPSA